MRILLDESVPKGLRQFLQNHSVTTVAERGWSSFFNGKLLGLAASDFDILVTADQNRPRTWNGSREGPLIYRDSSSSRENGGRELHRHCVEKERCRFGALHAQAVMPATS